MVHFGIIIVDNLIERLPNSPMRNCAVINAINLSPYASMPLPTGVTAFESVCAYAQDLPEVEKVFILAEPTNSINDGQGLPLVKESWNVQEMLKTLEDLGGEFEHIFYLFGDTPLLDAAISEKMYANHIRYFTQYTFADGFPLGLTPEIIKTSSISMMRKLAEEHETQIQRDSIFSVIQKDINAFDIETEIAGNDQRLLRISLSADNKRNYLQLESLIKAGAEDLESTVRAVEKNGHFFRTIPAYASIQIINGCPQACSYCPFPQFGGAILEQRTEMSLQQFEVIIDKLHAFTEDLVVNISLWGEPSLHSKVPDLAEAVWAKPGFSLLVETSGVGWQEEQMRRMVDAGGNRLRWIVSLDAIDEALYRDLRGEGFEEAQKTASLLIELCPDNAHVQAVRLKQSEDRLESFYRSWKEKTDNVIIQKYDHFSGLLPERKVTDLSPLVRMPCWHLKRDLSILLDGTVPVCREDTNKSLVLGNIFHDTVENIWSRGTEWYLKHLKAEYPTLCRQCDEYYTYNF